MFRYPPNSLSVRRASEPEQTLDAAMRRKGAAKRTEGVSKNPALFLGCACLYRYYSIRLLIYAFCPNARNGVHSTLLFILAQQAYIMQFKDRSEAGRLLAQALEGRISSGAIVIAIPRGGVVIGHEIARRFGCPLGITIPRKVGALENPELAIGAVAEDGSSYVDSAAASVAGADQAYVDRAIEREKAEIDRRKSIYCAALGILDLSGRDIILVDDGIATGYTMLAAIRYLRKKKPSSITVAVPVAPADVAQEIIREADGIVCLYLPGLLRAIGEFYLDFGEVNDDTVVRLLGSGSNP